jgi:hypothetical protein
VQDAATAFGMQLKDILRQTVAGLSKTDAQPQVCGLAPSRFGRGVAAVQP